MTKARILQQVGRWQINSSHFVKTGAPLQIGGQTNQTTGWNAWTAMGEVDEQERTTSQVVRDLPCYLLSVCLTTSFLQFLEVVKELAKDRIQV